MTTGIAIWKSITEFALRQASLSSAILGEKGPGFLHGDPCPSSGNAEKCVSDTMPQKSHLVKSRIDSTDFCQPAIWHVTHGVGSCQNCHCLQKSGRC